MSADDHRPPASKLPASPDDVRGVLRELRDDPPPDEREFAARLHRRLAAAGAPPAATWFGRLAEGAREKRSLITGAVLGALVTAVALTWLSGDKSTREAMREPEPASPAAIQTVGVTEPPRPVLRPSSGDHKSHTLGDRRLKRDRMGTDIGAERAERPRTHTR